MRDYPCTSAHYELTQLAVTGVEPTDFLCTYIVVGLLNQVHFTVFTLAEVGREGSVD